MSATQKNSVYKIENVIVEKEGGFTYLTMETLCDGKYSEAWPAAGFMDIELRCFS